MRVRGVFCCGMHASQADMHGSKRLRVAFGRVAREPLVHFAVLGGLIWGIGSHLQPADGLPVITVTKARTAQIAEHYRQQYGAAPTAEQLDSLVAAAITEEMFYRKAVELGLDRDDEIVRRRLVQKYEFLQQDLADSAPPGEADLRLFFAHNAARYRLPERVTFTHVYFSPDHSGDEGARHAADTAAATLNKRAARRAADEGDRFPGPQDVTALSGQELAHIFGQDGLSQDVFALPLGRWSIPLRSGFGWHTVFLLSRQPSIQPDFATVRERVEQDYLDAARSRHNVYAIEQLRRQFRIVRE